MTDPPTMRTTTRPDNIKWLYANGRSVRCNTGKRFAIAVPAHRDADRLHITKCADTADEITAEVHRLAATRLATTVVYVFGMWRQPAERLVLTLDEDALARIAIKEQP